ncbi:MAG: DUF262 domain-containing HNH endonuclease family protein [Spirochaetes bacterium]|nr:DUF262 domain-containing HNH endonuclease family protein [Spirochaetota bacterium]
MKTENHSINDVLNKNATSFYIPPFQRAYAWGKPEIERYFSDILRIIESELDNSQRDKLEHFFGTLVIKEETEGFASKSVVVDGQQRLTTTLLFLIALRDLETEDAKQSFITDNYLKNNASTFQDKIKLKQVTKDWAAYRALVNKENPMQGIIYNAYLLFIKLINETKRSCPNLKAEHFILAIKRMNVAVIFLDERPFKGEDPQIIFETLNSLGKPLTLSDLVRNFVLLNMNSNNQSKIYEDIWHPKIEAVLNENTSYFFRDYLQYKKASPIKVVNDNNTKELYQLFKIFVEENFNTHSDFINDIIRYVYWYKWIISEIIFDNISSDSYKNIEIKELLRNIFHDIKAEAFKPFVLGLLEYHQYGVNNIKIDDELLIAILKTIRTYLIRRRILGLTQGENKNIVLLCDRINELAKGDVKMVEFLSNMFYRMRFPNDNELKNILVSINFYEGLKKYSKFILGKIEENKTKVSVDFRNQKITIEHIMPQKLSNSWEKELGSDFLHIHKTYLHNIGNLILTEFNNEIGNKTFEEKKVKLNTSSLNYRLTIIDKNIWNEKSIKEHQENMIKWFLDTFPLSESYKFESNWNTIVTESKTFSPLDNDAVDLAEGNKPVELRIYNNTFKVKTWQDVFIKFIEHIKNNKNIDFEYILENQIELFNKTETIISWLKLKEIIEDKIELSNRYKTINGKTWKNVPNLNDNEIFIHINISAYTCITRINNIMNKFNISNNDVEIDLK